LKRRGDRNSLMTVPIRWQCPYRGRQSHFKEVILGKSSVEQKKKGGDHRQIQCLGGLA
jgi:hypothetical protein